jgi:hypothetical protein
MSRYWSVEANERQDKEASRCQAVEANELQHVGTGLGTVDPPCSGSGCQPCIENAKELSCVGMERLISPALKVTFRTRDDLGSASGSGSHIRVTNTAPVPVYLAPPTSVVV